MANNYSIGYREWESSGTPKSTPKQQSTTQNKTSAKGGGSSSIGFREWNPSVISKAAKNGNKSY